MISSPRVVRNFTPASDCGFVNGPQASGVTLAIDGQEIFTEFLGSGDAWCHKERLPTASFARRLVRASRNQADPCNIKNRFRNSV